jgi:hypothetical protein
LMLAACVAVPLALLLHTLGPAILRDPWNPWVTVLPFGLVIMAAWATGEGDRAALFTFVVVSSFLVQTHVGFALPVVLIAAVAVVGFVRRRTEERGAGSASWRRSLVVAGGIGVICWLPLVAHVLTGGDNLVRLFHYFVSGVPTAGVGYALDVVRLELGGRAPWLGTVEAGNAVGGGLLPGETAGLVWSVVPFLVAVVLAWRGRRATRPHLRLLGTVGVAAIAGLLAVSRISGPVFSYLVRWWWPIAALWWAAIAWAVWGAVSRRLPERVRLGAAALSAGLAAALVALLCLQTLTMPAPLLDSSDENRAQSALADFTARAVPQVSTDRPVLFRWVGPRVRWVGDGFALQLAKAGRDVRVDDDDTNPLKFGPQRVLAEPDASSRAVWVVSGLQIDDFTRAGTGREIARWDPLSPDERREANDGLLRLRRLFKETGREDLVAVIDDGGSLWPAKDFPGIDQAELDRLEELQLRGQPVGVFLYEHADQASLPPK